ncbi:MAG: hypothetical protein KF749_00135 [Bacteroidetes bacterium]|nr:hypothetical protein [Bacteroidota bacterium]MCW5897239.1 hypothetical protein [Bacteroidota bacterium]
MMYVAKGLEALGIACLGLGLILGINSPTLWVELYLFLLGIFVFFIGWGIEKIIARRQKAKSSS